MPPPGHRKKPFSAKQKKRQLQDKRDRRRDIEELGEHSRGRWRGRMRGCHRGYRGRGGHFIASDQSREHTESSDDYGGDETEILRVHKQPTKEDKAYDPNRYRLHFLKEHKQEIEHRKELARLPLEELSEEALETNLEDIYKPGSVLDMPKRPPWNYKMDKNSLIAREEKYFKSYLEDIFEKYEMSELSYFEMNLETWRQLWRVVEMSDIVLLITDIRHPALNFSPALYNYVIKELKKPLVVVLNKIDIAPAPLVVAWRHYFQERFSEVHILCFTSFPKDTVDLSEDPAKVIRKRRRKSLASTAVGPRELLKACEAIVQGKVDLSSWQEKIEEDMVEAIRGEIQEEPHDVNLEDLDTSFAEHERYKDGVLTIGCCGYPNVGKSSLINGLMGKKVVSVSRTPGHTKHFQTIFLTPTVKLCDCPGLVFPSLVPKPMQILSGIYPIAQVREPYTAVGYLAERVPLVSLLSLRHPDADTTRPDLRDNVDREWSAMDVCDAWALKRGFLTAKAARLDTYRAANSLLRLCMEGRIVMCLRPPRYFQRREFWENHPEADDITAQQVLHRRRYLEASFDGDVEVSVSEDEQDEEGSVEAEEKEENGREKGEDEEPEKDNSCVAVSNPFALLADDD